MALTKYLRNEPTQLSVHNSATAVALRRRWLIVLPATFITYSLAYMDRVNYGFGAAAGMASDLHITGSQSAFLAGIFFIGYLTFQVPGSAYAQRKSAVALIFWALLGWGTLAALTGVIRVFWLLAIDRFLLGAAESLVMPAMLVLLMKWFTPSERSRANAVLILGNPVTVVWMSASTGYLMQSVGWRLAFIIEGLPSILWALAWLRLVPETPDVAPWFTNEAACYVYEKQNVVSESVLELASVSEVVKRRDVILLCAQFCTWSLGLYGLVIWLPAIIRDHAHSMGATGLFSAAPYLFASVAMIVVALASDRTAKRSRLVWPFLWIAGISMFLSFAMSGHSFKIAYLFLIVAAAGIYAPYGPFWANVSVILPRPVVGKAIGLINACGAVGGALGSWAVGVLRARTGNSDAGFLLMSGSLILSGILVLLLRSLNNDQLRRSVLNHGMSSEK